MRLSNRALPESAIRRVTREAAAIPGCIALTLGEPEFDAPLAVRQGIARAILAGDTHYPPNAGDPTLRAQIAAHANARFACDYAPEEAVITIGATQALMSALLAILSPGDEVITPAPCFPLYRTQIALAGGVCVPMDTTDDGFQLTPERLLAHVTPRTRAVLYASPGNPTGEVLSGASLAALREAALRCDLFLIADSVYDSLVYDAPAPSLMGDAALRDRLIYVSALSKPYAMTGVRVGYALGDAPVTAQMVKVHSALVSCAPGCIQRGCIGVFDTDVSSMLAAYRQRRDWVHRHLCAMGLPARLPGGAFYLYPSVRRTGLDADAFCRRLMREAGVALVPSTCFGAAGHARLSYCCGEDMLREAIRRMERFMTQFPR